MSKLDKIIADLKRSSQDQAHPTWSPPHQAVTNRQLREALEAVQYELRQLRDWI